MTFAIRGGLIAASAAFAALIGWGAPQSLAQNAPQAAPAPAAPPAWQQGRSAEQAESPLHPHVPPLIAAPAKDIPIQNIKLPPGFKIEIWASVPEARTMTLGAKGTVFVGNRIRDEVVAVVDRGDHREVMKIAKGLKAPNGVAFKDGTLFVAERERIIRFDDIENHLDHPPEPTVVIDGLPQQPNHFWKFLVVGPDGWLYFNQGAPFNIGLPNYIQAAILRVNPETRVMEQYATGVRNSVGMAFHPETKELWFTDNGRDWLSDDTPSDKLNRATAKGENFGYPFCHQGDLPDPEYGKYRSCSEFTPPALKLGPHVAPLGMRFYTGTMFPPEYHNNIIIAEHGSWNRSTKTAYNLTRVVLGPKGEVVKHEVFMSGLLQGNDFWGRVPDVLVMPDGALLVSDDWNGAIYRISYAKS
ncbi:MAG TPA: PQQ-dependent sugar dehydrogenase [Stellaceae bacterium]|nr:PQQ-dependent sugar dehydrogenase [Stellaceae bacterium]